LAEAEGQIMDLSAAIPPLIITLREGVEAALVVGIVLACLKKAKTEALNIWVYAGVVGGIAASVLVGILFSWGIQSLYSAYPDYAAALKPLMEAIFGVVAIALLSWMLIWMTSQAKSLKAEIEGNVATITNSSRAGWGVFGLVFMAVLREGFETVVFIIAKFQLTLVPILGAITGLLGAVAIGFLLFKWGVKINIRRFFQIMGIFLLIIVAGLVVSALKHFDQTAAALVEMNPTLGLCVYYDHFAANHSCILGPIAWNTSNILPDHQFPGLILKTLFGYRDKLYLVQVIAYLGFLFTIGSLYFNSLGTNTISPKPELKP
jgi:high-affinity iron transporter